MKKRGHILPNACPDCGSDMVLKISKYDPFYGCKRFPKCKASHGAHGDGSGNKWGEPLGIPVDSETRKARQDAHAVFDRHAQNLVPRADLGCDLAQFGLDHRRIGLVLEPFHLESARGAAYGAAKLDHATGVRASDARPQRISLKRDEDVFKLKMWVPKGQPKPFQGLAQAPP